MNRVHKAGNSACTNTLCSTQLCVHYSNKFRRNSDSQDKVPSIDCKEKAPVTGDSVMSELIFSFLWSVFFLSFIKKKTNTLLLCHYFWCLWKWRAPSNLTVVKSFFKTFYTSFFYLYAQHTNVEISCILTATVLCTLIKVCTVTF